MGWRLLLVLPLGVVAGVAVAPQPSAFGATSGASCRRAELRRQDEAVFGHFATPAAARALAKHATAEGFKGTKVTNDGCGDYEVEIDGDKPADRVSFAAEAQKAGFPVTF